MLMNRDLPGDPDVVVGLGLELGVADDDAGDVLDPGLQVRVAVHVRADPDDDPDPVAAARGRAGAPRPRGRPREHWERNRSARRFCFSALPLSVGRMAALSLSAREVAFRGVARGRGYSAAAVVQNVSDRTHAIRVVPPTLSDFQVLTRGPTSLSPGMKCTILVSFHCKEYREFHDYVTISCDDGSIYKIKLSAYICIPEIRCEGLLNYGIVQCGFDIERQIEIFNDGGMDGILRLDFKQSEEQTEEKDIAELSYAPTDLIIPAHSSRMITMQLKPIGEGVFRKIVNAFLLPSIMVKDQETLSEEEIEIINAVNEVLSMFPHRLSAIIDVNATSQAPKVNLVPNNTSLSICMLGEEKQLIYNVVNESGVSASFNLSPFIVPGASLVNFVNNGKNMKYKEEKNGKADMRIQTFFHYVEFEPSYGTVSPMSSFPVIVKFKPLPDGQGPEGESYMKMASTWRFSKQVDIDEFIRLLADFIDKEVAAYDVNTQNNNIATVDERFAQAVSPSHLGRKGDLESLPRENIGEQEGKDISEVEITRTLVSKLDLGDSSLTKICKENSCLNETLESSMNKCMRNVNQSDPSFLSGKPLPPISDVARKDSGDIIGKDISNYGSAHQQGIHLAKREGSVIERCSKMILKSNENRNNGIVDCNEIDEGLLNPSESITFNDQPIDVSDENNLNIRRILGTYIIQEKENVRLRCLVSPGPNSAADSDNNIHNAVGSINYSQIGKNQRGNKNNGDDSDSSSSLINTSQQYEVQSQLTVVCFVPMILMSHQKLVFGCSHINIFNPSGYKKNNGYNSSKTNKPIPLNTQKELRRIDFQIRSFSSQPIWIMVETQSPYFILFKEKVCYLHPSRTVTIPVVYNPKTVGVHKNTLDIFISGTKQGLKSSLYKTKIQLIGCAIFDDNERLREKEIEKKKQLNTFKQSLISEKQRRFLIETLMNQKNKGVSDNKDSSHIPMETTEDTMKIIKEYNRQFLPPPEILTEDELALVDEQFMEAQYIVLTSDKPSIRLREMEIAVLGASPKNIEKKKRRFISELNKASNGGNNSEQFIITDALDSSNCIDDPTSLSHQREIASTSMKGTFNSRRGIIEHPLIRKRLGNFKKRKDDYNGLSEPDPFTPEELKEEYGEDKVWCTSDEINKGVSMQSLSKIVRINKKIHNYKEPATLKLFPDVVDLKKTPEFSLLNVIMSENSRYLTSSKMTQGAKETLYLNFQITGKQSDNPVLITVLKYFDSVGLDTEILDEDRNMNGLELIYKGDRKLFNNSKSQLALTGGQKSDHKPLNPNNLNMTQLEQMTRKEIELYKKTNGSGMSTNSNHVIFEQCSQVVPPGSICTFKINMELNSPGHYFEQFIVLLNGNVSNKLTLCNDNSNKNIVRNLSNNETNATHIYNKEHTNVIIISGKVGECRLNVFDENYTYADSSDELHNGNEEIQHPKLLMTTKSGTTENEFICKTITLRNPGDVEVGFKIKIEKLIQDAEQKSSRNSIDIAHKNYISVINSQKNTKGSESRLKQINNSSRNNSGKGRQQGKGGQDNLEASQNTLILNQLEEELFVIPTVGLISPFSEISVKLKWNPKSKPYDVNELQTINPNNLFKYVLIEKYKLQIDIARMKVISLPLETQLFPTLLQFSGNNMENQQETMKINSPLGSPDSTSRKYDQNSMWNPTAVDISTSNYPKTSGRFTERQNTTNGISRRDKRYYCDMNLGYVNYGSNEPYSFTLSNQWETNAYFTLNYSNSNLYGGNKQMRLPKEITLEDIPKIVSFDNPTGTVKGHSTKTITFYIRPKMSFTDNVQFDENFVISVRGGISLRLRVKFMLTVPKLSIFTGIPKIPIDPKMALTQQAPIETSVNIDNKPLLNFSNTPLYSTRFQDLYLTNSGYSPTTIILDISSASPTSINSQFNPELLGDLYFHLEKKDKSIEINDSKLHNIKAELSKTIGQISKLNKKGDKEEEYFKDVGYDSKNLEHNQNKINNQSNTNEPKIQTGIPLKYIRKLRKQLINIDKVMNGNMDSLSKYGVFNCDDISNMLKELKNSEKTRGGITREMIINALQVLNYIIMDAKYSETKFFMGNKENCNINLSSIIDTLIDKFDLEPNISNFVKVKQKNDIPQRQKATLSSDQVTDMQRALLNQALGIEKQDKQGISSSSSNRLALYKSLTINIQPNETKHISVCFCPSDISQVSKEPMNVGSKQLSELLPMSNIKFSVNVINTTIEWPIWMLVSVVKPTIYTNVKAINLGVLNANNRKLSNTNVSTDDMQYIRLYNKTNLDYRYSIRLDDETIGSFTPFLIQDTFGVVRSSPKDYVDIRILLQAQEGYYYSKIIIECTPDQSKGMVNLDNPENITITIPISCCFLRPYIYVPKMYLPVTPINTPSACTGYIYNIGYDDISVSVCGLNKSNPDMTPFSNEASIDTLDVPLVISFPWGTKLNKMVRRIPLNVFFYAGRATDFDIIVKLGVTDNSVSSSKEMYDLRIVGGCCNSRIYSEEMFANNSNGTVRVAISRNISLHSKQQEDDNVTKLDNNRLAIVSNINNNYYKYTDAESGIIISNNAFKTKIR